MTRRLAEPRAVQHNFAVTMAPLDSRPVHWSGTGRLRGGRWGIWFFITALRLLGLRLTYALLVPPVIYFTFVSPAVPPTLEFHRAIAIAHPLCGLLVQGV